MRWVCWLLIGLLLSSTTGCSCGTGAATVDDMKRFAIARPDDEEEEALLPQARPAETSDIEPAPAPPTVAPPTPAPAPQPAPLPEPEVAATPKTDRPAPVPTPPPPTLAEGPDALDMPADDEVASLDISARPQPQPAEPIEEPTDAAPVPDAPATPRFRPTPEPAVEDARLPLPDAAEQQAGKRLLAELYKADYDQAKTPDQKQALARRLYAEAGRLTDDPTGQYLLYRLTLDLAVAAGDVKVAVEASEKQAATFQVAAAEQLDRFAVLAKTLRSQAAAQAFLAHCRTGMRGALEEDDFDAAEHWLELAKIVARRGKLQEQLKQIERGEHLVAETKVAYAEVPAARSSLAANPIDPAAHLEVGKYLCFYRREWNEGLAHLAAGSDVKLKILARIDQSFPREALQQADVGDQWYDLATSHTKPWVQGSLLLRAAHWYELSRKDLPQGLLKTRVEKRLADIAMLTGEKSLQKFAVSGKGPPTSE